MRQSVFKSASGVVHYYDISRTFTTLLVFGALLIGAMLCASSVNATTNNMQTVVLSIQGNIEGKKRDVISFSLSSLTKLESTTFTTDQPWTTEPKEYTGVRISTLLEHIGAGSSEFVAMASNDYQFTLSDIDFEKYPIIVAYKVDSEYVDARKLGPLLIVFPFNDHPELFTGRNKAASVWQLTEMKIL